MRPYSILLILVACGVILGCGPDSQESPAPNVEPSSDVDEDSIPYDMAVDLGRGVTLHRGELIGRFWGDEVDGPANILEGEMFNDRLVIKVIVEEETHAVMSLMTFYMSQDELTPGNEFYRNENISTNGCSGSSAQSWTTDAHTDNHYIQVVDGPDDSIRVLFDLSFYNEDRLMGSFDFSKADEDGNN